MHIYKVVLNQETQDILPESLVERVGLDDVHLLAEGGRVWQPERVGLERLVRNVLNPAGERVASTTNKDKDAKNNVKGRETAVRHLMAFLFVNTCVDWILKRNTSGRRKGELFVLR